MMTVVRDSRGVQIFIVKKIGGILRSHYFYDKPVLIILLRVIHVVNTPGVTIASIVDSSFFYSIFFLILTMMNAG